jgi:hypothetical protein
LEQGESMHAKQPRLHLNFWFGLLIVGLLTTAGARSSSKSYYAENFDVVINIQKKGSILVNETVDFRFEGGPFTYVFRELETRETDDIVNIQAMIDGQTLSEGTNPGQVEIKRGDRIRVVWHFLPVSDVTHTFSLNYQVMGAIRIDEDLDVLKWVAIPEKHDYLIQSSTISVLYPRSAKLNGRPVINQGDGWVEPGNARVIVQAKNLDKDDPLWLSLRFPHGHLIDKPPEWQRLMVARVQAIYRILPWALALLVFAILGGAGGLVLFWETSAGIDRDEAPEAKEPSAIQNTGQVSPITPVQSVYPPNDLPAAFAGALASPGLHIRWAQAMGTLLDLARREAICVQESTEKSWLRQRDFVIQRGILPAGLRPHEQTLVKMLFETTKGPRDSVRISEMGRTLPPELGDFARIVKIELEEKGLVSKRREERGRRLIISGTVMFLSSLALTMVAVVALSKAAQVENWVFLNIAMLIAGITAGIFLDSLAIMIVGNLYSPLTSPGMQEAAIWKAYAEILREVTRGREPVLRPDVFEIALPYAASLGLVETWTHFFQKHGEAQAPTWFQMLSSRSDEGGMAAFAAMIAASCAAGSSSEASGGAAGGGSSGAG